jgi:hypothetical protein
MQDSEKTLLFAYGSGHLMRIKAGDPRQCTYLMNLQKKPLVLTKPHLSLLTRGRRNPSMTTSLHYLNAQKINGHTKLQV